MLLASVFSSVLIVPFSVDAALSLPLFSVDVSALPPVSVFAISVSPVLSPEVPGVLVVLVEPGVLVDAGSPAPGPSAWTVATPVTKNNTEATTTLATPRWCFLIE